jgi:hypothetical protein
MRGWAVLVAGPGLVAVVVTASWFALTGLLSALVTWPGLAGVAVMGVAAARAATDPSKTTINRMTEQRT